MGERASERASERRASGRDRRLVSGRLTAEERCDRGVVERARGQGEGKAAVRCDRRRRSTEARASERAGRAKEEGGRDALARPAGERGGRRQRLRRAADSGALEEGGGRAIKRGALAGRQRGDGGGGGRGGGGGASQEETALVVVSKGQGWRRGRRRGWRRGRRGRRRPSDYIDGAARQRRSDEEGAAWPRLARSRVRACVSAPPNAAHRA
jgi:hypothetical protein